MCYHMRGWLVRPVSGMNRHVLKGEYYDMTRPTGYFVARIVIFIAWLAFQIAGIIWVRRPCVCGAGAPFFEKNLDSHTEELYNDATK